MALSKKKAVHILSITEDKITTLKEIPLPEPPLHMVSVCLIFIFLIIHTYHFADL